MENLELSCVLLIVDCVLAGNFPLHSFKVVELPGVALIGEVELTFDLVWVHDDDPGPILVHVDGTVGDLCVISRSEEYVSIVECQGTWIDVDRRLAQTALATATPVFTVLGVISCKSKADQ